MDPGTRRAGLILYRVTITLSNKLQKNKKLHNNRESGTENKKAACQRLFCVYFFQTISGVVIGTQNIYNLVLV